MHMQPLGGLRHEWQMSALTAHSAVPEMPGVFAMEGIMRSSAWSTALHTCLLYSLEARLAANVALRLRWVARLRRADGILNETEK